MHYCLKEDKTDVKESFEKSAGGSVFEFQRIPLIRKDRISMVPVSLTYGTVRYGVSEFRTINFLSAKLSIVFGNCNCRHAENILSKCILDKEVLVDMRQLVNTP